MTCFKIVHTVCNAIEKDTYKSTLHIMEHKFVSKSGQMESPVECEGLLDEGHRCGACHKVSDAKVRITIKHSKEEVCNFRVFLHISHLPLIV